jgi:hypothetical protein
MKPRFGARHPDLAALLKTNLPVASHEITWAGGTMPLWVGAHTTRTEPPSELVTSVRCVVRVGDLLVLCENSDGRHPWPGGRRLPGESFIDTAVREVHEETGWLVDRESFRRLGWLHLMHLAPRQPGDSSVYPDFLQVIYCATASQRDGALDQDWVDTDGYELRSRLVTVGEALEETSVDLLAPVYLQLLRSESGWPS